MVMATEEVGAYKAKTHLPELLRGVQRGKRYLITHHGEVVAELCQVKAAQQENLVSVVTQMKHLMACAQTLRAVDLKVLIEEGRD